MLKIVAVGECTIDRYLDLGIERVGGISLNFAVNARRSGAAEAALVSCTGDDPGADLVIARLDREGIDRSHVWRLPGHTATQDIVMAEGGERIFPPGGYHARVLADFQLHDDDLAFIRGFDVVAAPFFRQIEHLFRAAILDPKLHARRVVDLLDGGNCGPDLFGIRPFLPALDLVFISGEQALVDRLQPLTTDGQTTIVVTHGAAGSTALAAGAATFQAAIPVPNPVDTTGAGDAFQAAFTVAYFGGGSIADALAAGAACAARVIQLFGATEDR